MEIWKELKPCPFCGGKARCNPYRWLGDTSYYVDCEECKSSTNHFDHAKEAVVAWNRRYDAKT